MSNRPLNASELAERLNVDRSTLRRWTKEQGFPPPDIRTPGGRRLYSPVLVEGLEEWLNYGRSGLRDRIRWALDDLLEPDARLPFAEPADAGMTAGHDRDTLARLLCEALGIR